MRAVILGVIEGLTEFLPVSSTGHMVLANPLLGVDSERPTWKVFLFVSQIGAILAVILYFWRDLWRQTFTPAKLGWHNHLVTKLFVAFLPAAIVGVSLDDYFEPLEKQPMAVAAALIVGGIAMEILERCFRKTGEMRIDDVTLRQALLIGIAQCVSIWPGVSRAAATIVGGLIVGLPPRVAAQFSFYLAIPTILGAGAKRLMDNWGLLSADGATVILVGTVVAFFVALGVVATFLPYVQRHRFTPFAIYRIVLGVGVLLYFQAA